MEKGDTFVLLSLVVLALIFLFPFYRGRDLGSREQVALQALLQIRKSAIDSGLVERLESIGNDISGLPGLRPQIDGPTIMAQSHAPILWVDGDYEYTIRFRGFLGTGPALIVSPAKPGVTGDRRFLWSPGQELKAELIASGEAHGDPELMDTAEQKAREQATRIIPILMEADLGDLCPSLCSQIGKPLEPILEPEFGCLSPMWMDGNYLFRISIAMTRDGLDLDLWAWPRVRGSTGFDAFFVSGRSIPAQSWNMSNPYDGLKDLKSIPIPGNARDRTGAQLGLDDNWVGWDGKRWFVVETED